jgi:chromosome partitioning protein
MPVIVFSSPKGGSGKTTSATILATELAERGASVTIIDADPNRNVVDWAKLPGVPKNLTVLAAAATNRDDEETVVEETIIDQIEEASAKTAFVIVDLEGVASLLMSYALSRANFVVIPVQGSQLDAKQAARQMKLIRDQGRVVGRAIPFAVLLTRTNPAIVPRTQRHIEERFSESSVPIFQTRLYDREAFRAMFSYGGTLSGLAGKGVSNLDAAIRNAHAFAAEVIQRLREGETIKEVA